MKSNSQVKKQEKRRFRRYLWSANVKEHGNTVFKFGVYSSAVAGTVSLAAFAAINSVSTFSTEDRVLAVLAIILAWLAVWLTMFGIMSITYAALIAAQIEAIDPPAPPKPDRETVVYQREGQQTRLIKRTLQKGRGK